MQTVTNIILLVTIAIASGCTTTQQPKEEQGPERDRLSDAISTLNALKTNATGRDLVGLDSDGNIASLGMRETDFDDSHMHLLADMHHLNLLAFSECEISDAGMAQIGHTTTITAVYFENTNISSAGLRFLANCEGMNRAYLSGTEIDDESINTITRWERLEFLNVSDTSISKTGVRQLAALPMLESLIIDASQTDTANLAVIRKKYLDLKIRITPAP